MINKDSLKSFSDKITHYVAARRIMAALSAMRQLLDEVIAPWEMREELQRLQQDYSYLAQYALDGSPDPQRDDVYAAIVNGIMDLLARVRRDAESIDGTSLYFSTMRYEKMQTADTIASLVSRLRKDASVFEMTELASDADERVRSMRASLEALEKRLFNRVWVTYPLSADDEEALTALFDDEIVDTTTHMLIISALLLALLVNYDERAMYLLLDRYYRATDTRTRMRALTALLIAMSMHRGRRPGKRLAALLDTVRDTPGWDDDVRMTLLQFIRTRDTEKITRKMRDEVIPQMLKMRPDIYKKINENPDSMADPMAMEENPEWEELLEKSGIADKMREIQEMQEEGSDVMMSTFAHLKTYPFFNDAANWFLPFRERHTAVGDVAAAAPLAAVIAASPFLCNSDKYSVLLSVARIPQAQRDMLTGQFEAQNVNMAELSAASLADPKVQRERETVNYVQDLYRFFRLFRRKGEFTDPFATPLNLATVPLLSDTFTRSEHLSVVAEFYFRRGYYADALALFRRMADAGESSLPLYQKMGYALQQEGDIEGALRYYLQAELLAVDDLWTLRRIAACYRLLQRPADAIGYYERIAALKPEDASVALHAGHCYMELGRYREATQQYFKVEFLEEGSLRALRPIAWCSFLSGDYERSRDYYGRLPKESITSGDWLNMGHLEMATGHYRDAIDRYRRALDAIGSDRSKFASMMQADLHYLRAAGVPDLMTGLVLDALLSA